MTRTALVVLLLLVGTNIHADRPILDRASRPSQLIMSPADARRHDQTRLPFRIPTASSLLSVANLTCTGAFLTPGVGQGPSGAGGNYPVAMRYNSGTRQYFVMSGTDEHIISFREPSLSSCSSDPASMNRATSETDWGAYVFGAANSAGGDAVPGFNLTGVQGLHFDGSGNLIAGWSGNYSNVGSHNTFASMTLNNVAHTLSTNGCWGFNSPLTQPYAGGGMVTIPAAFVAVNLPAGHNFGVIGGWPFASVTSGISEGPTLYAIAPPTTNACTASTDTFVSSGTTLLQYAANQGGGPVCTLDGVTFYGMGCSFTPVTTPVTTISTPYPRQIAYTTYSRETYASDWEPYPTGTPTHGWAGFLSFGASDWYDDGIKHGYVTAFVTPEGWMSETVSSSSSATSFVVAATSTHDSLNVNVGDYFMVQTCTVGVDPNCNGDQSHYESEMYVSSINTSTHAITATIISQDQSGGNHFPVPGGLMRFGCFYAFGTPTCSRWEIRMQIDDPNDLAAVASGSKQPYEVTASDDQEIDQTLITGLGSPTAGTGVHVNNQQAPGISSVIADTTNHDLIVNLPFVQNPTFFIGNVIYILHITESSPVPFEVISATGLLYLLSLAWRGQSIRRVGGR